MKNPTRTIRPTIGTLSGLVTMSRKSKSVMLRPKKSRNSVDQPPGDDAVGDGPAVGDHRDEAERGAEEERGRAGDEVDRVADERAAGRYSPPRM